MLFYSIKLCARKRHFQSSATHPVFVLLVPGHESPRILRDGRPPKPLPRNLYSQVQPRGTKLYRSNSDCSSVMSYDLGDPRNSPAFPRHSSLYIPTRGHRPRAETINSARSSAIGMDLGEGVPKGNEFVEKCIHVCGFRHE